jgi:hypothetical protein
MHAHPHKHATPAQPGPTGPTPAKETAVASSNKDHNAPLVSDEAIRLCAYRKWESAGKPTGNDVQFWLEAEQDLRQGK